MNMLGKMPDSGRLISIESLFTRIAIRQFLCDAIPIDPPATCEGKRSAKCGCESVSESALRPNLIMISLATHTNYHNVISLVEKIHQHSIGKLNRASEFEDKMTNEMM